MMPAPCMTYSIPMISSLRIIYYIIGMLITAGIWVGASASLNEAQALMAFKAGISHDPFGRLQSWQLPMNDSSYISPCKVQEGHSATTPGSSPPPPPPPAPYWVGIVCNARTQYVTSVNLRSFNLSGSISPSLSFLPALSQLDLSDNLLSGTLPPALFALHSPIQYLNLSYNLLEGGLPDSLANLSALRTLDLSYNNFEGKVPTALGQLRDLKVLKLEETGLSENIPEEVWQLPALRELWITGDTLQIALPESLGFCSTITDLVLVGSVPSAQGLAIPSSLSHCRKLEVLAIDIVEGLQGFIAPQIWQLPVLQVLVVRDRSSGFNFRSGPLPDSFASCPTISQLALEGFDVAGSSIPSSLGACHSLQVLILHLVGLRGYVPPQIWQLPLLQTLFVVDEEALQGMNNGDKAQFNLYGSLPLNFSFCPSIEELVIDGVNLTGEVPPSLGQCTSLQYLDLSHGRLHGVVPDSFQNLTNIKNLHLQGNNLAGEIPASLSACSQLESLRLGDNPQLSGTIPRELGELAQLKALSLFTVALSGPMPEELCNCSQLVWLDLAWPWTGVGMGKLPDCISRLSLLETLGWQMNIIDGVVPINVLRNLTQLQYLGMSLTQVRGRIPDELGNLSQLQMLDFSKNNLSGPLPKSLQNCSNLQILRLFENSLTGEIEHFNFTRLPQLQTFTVHRNDFTGALPSSIFTGCPQLALIDVQSNKLAGSFGSQITEEMSVMGSSNLRVLVMSYNNLSGELPGWLWKLPMLQVLDLSNNQFNGIMPTDVGSLPYFKKDQMHSEKLANLYEEIPETIKFTNQVLKYIIYTRKLFDVSMNHLEGEIAESFGQLVGLYGLNLSHNRIQGRIPASLGNLINLDVLDLSHNRLTGAIPKELGNLGGLSTVDLSYNNLEGRIPDTKFFNTRFDNKSFAHNPLLCGAPLVRNCSSGQQGSTNHTSTSTTNLAKRIVRKIENFASLWGLLLGHAIGFFGVLYLRHCT